MSQLLDRAKATIAALVLASCLSLVSFAAPALAADNDHDGYAPPADCNDANAAIHPGAVDRPDLQFVDSNCDGIDGDSAKAVFVAPNGSDNGTGTKDNPFQTIQKGVDTAKGHGKDVYVSGGTFAENGGGGLSMPADADGVGIYGGYTPGTWERSLTTEPTVLTGASQAATLDGATGVVFQLLELDGNRGGGLSAYGLRAVNGSRVVLDAVKVTAGAGGGGAPGSSPARPGQANGGANAAPAPNCETASPGAGGGTSAIGAAGGGGGGGGPQYGDRPGTSGGGGSNDASPSGTGGKGGSRGDDGSGNLFGNGGDSGVIGSTGTAGGNGSAGQLAASYWNTVGPGWNGANGGGGSGGGTGGGGGGGGGGSGGKIVSFGVTVHWTAGSGGGGGGAGGAGGAPGTAGGSGGGSFAAYLWNSQLVSEHGTSLIAANGGAGGAGGTGALGGLGGTGGSGGSAIPVSTCVISAGGGGNGGSGGTGGKGGNAGGGTGGPTAGVFRGGPDSIFTKKDTSTATAGAQPGAAGAGPIPSSPGDRADVLGPGSSATSDFDGDGVTDANDSCPADSGPLANQGCPAVDTDGDGVPDYQDACPAVYAGGNDADRNGCPDPVGGGGSGGAPTSGGGTPTGGSAPATGKTVLHHIVVILAYFVHARAKSSQFTQLSVRSVPHGATVHVTCKGPGCPKRLKGKGWTKKNAKSAVSLKAFIAKPLKVGTTITIVVSKPNTIAAVKVLKVRASRKPAIQNRCLEPGAKTATSC